MLGGTTRLGGWLRGAGLLAVAAAPASAHVGPAGAGPWWTQWSADPLIVSNLVLLAGLYTIGWRRRHRLQPAPRAVRPWQAAAFAGGLLALVVALLSPVDVLANELLWVHMIQHMVLMNVAAPLVVLGAPARVLWWALADERRHEWARWRRRRGRPPRRYLLWQPVTLWLLYALVLWIWHLPALYEGALAYPWLHDVQHVVFFGAAALFWRVLFDPVGRLRMGRLAATLYLFTTSLHATLLGVFMALAPRFWYATYGGRAPRWGWDPLADQQLAGYIMWMPACMAYALIAAILFATWLARPGGTEPAGPRAGPPAPGDQSSSMRMLRNSIGSP